MAPAAERTTGAPKNCALTLGGRGGLTGSKVVGRRPVVRYLSLAEVKMVETLNVFLSLLTFIEV